MFVYKSNGNINIFSQFSLLNVANQLFSPNAL